MQNSDPSRNGEPMEMSIGYVKFLLSDIVVCRLELEKAEVLVNTPHDPADDEFGFWDDALEKRQNAKEKYEGVLSDLRREVDKAFPGRVEALYKVHLSGVITLEEMVQAIHEIVDAPPSTGNVKLPTDGL